MGWLSKKVSDAEWIQEVRSTSAIETLEMVTKLHYREVLYSFNLILDRPMSEEFIAKCRKALKELNELPDPTSSEYRDAKKHMVRALKDYIKSLECSFDYERVMAEFNKTHARSIRAHEKERHNIHRVKATTAKYGDSAEDYLRSVYSITGTDLFEKHRFGQ